MSELKARLRADMTAAMKSKDTLVLATLRMVLAAIQTAETSGTEAHDLTDAQVISLLQKEAKKRNEAAVYYEQAGRGELAANEHAEEAVIESYLPTPLDDAEVAEVADTAIAQVAQENGERPGMKQMGQVMKIATALANGKADGSRLSAAVRARL
ncbi:GatB/YqeY domain-containing protein [Nocardia camponoti]|nr:GatB/YqeY domain-containing protein [Nocardia camponoti]